MADRITAPGTLIQANAGPSVGGRIEATRRLAASQIGIAEAVLDFKDVFDRERVLLQEIEAARDAGDALNSANLEAQQLEQHLMSSRQGAAAKGVTMDLTEGMSKIEQKWFMNISPAARELAAPQFRHTGGTRVRHMSNWQQSQMKAWEAEIKITAETNAINEIRNFPDDEELRKHQIAIIISGIMGEQGVSFEARFAAVEEMVSTLQAEALLKVAEDNPAEAQRLLDIYTGPNATKTEKIEPRHAEAVEEKIKQRTFDRRLQEMFTELTLVSGNPWDININEVVKDARAEFKDPSEKEEAGNRIRAEIKERRTEFDVQQGEFNNAMAEQLTEMVRLGDFQNALDMLKNNPDERFRTHWSVIIRGSMAGAAETSGIGVEAQIAGLPFQVQRDLLTTGALSIHPGLSLKGYEREFARIQGDIEAGHQRVESVVAASNAVLRSDKFRELDMDPHYTATTKKQKKEFKKEIAWDENMDLQVKRWLVDNPDKTQPSNEDMERLINIASLNIIYDFDLFFDDTKPRFMRGVSQLLTREFVEDPARYNPDEIRDITDVPFEFEQRIIERDEAALTWDGIRMTEQEIADEFRDVIVRAKEAR